MKRTGFEKTGAGGRENCEAMLQHLDSHLDGEAQASVSEKLVAHVKECTDCANELELRRTMRSRLRNAVHDTATPPHLETSIRKSLTVVERSSTWNRRLMLVAAAVAVCVGGSIAYQLGYLRFTAASQESYIASVSSRLVRLMQVGLGDHIHCSVFRKFPKNPPAVEQLANTIAPEYSGLIPIVTKHVPSEYRLAIAHECRYHGRKFVHLSLKSGSSLLSLVITSKRDGESFERDQVIPALKQSGISFYSASAQRFEIASFESRDHLVYFISDLSRQENTDMMLAIAPQVQEFLRKMQS